MARGARAAHRLQLDLRHLRRAGARPDGRDASAGPDQPLRRVASWPSSGRCSTTRARACCGRSPCATSTRPAATRTAALGEDHDPEEHLDPAGDRRRARPPPGAHRSTATTTTRPTAPASATTSTCRTWRARTCWRWRPCDRREPFQAFNLGSGTGYSVQQVVEAVGRIAGRAVPAHGRSAPPRRSAAAGGAPREAPASGSASRRHSGLDDDRRDARSAGVAMHPARLRPARLKRREICRNAMVRRILAGRSAHAKACVRKEIRS